jgi:hypothetical protein
MASHVHARVSDAPDAASDLSSPCLKDKYASLHRWTRGV